MNAQDSCSKTPVNNQVLTGVHIALLVLLTGCDDRKRGFLMKDKKVVGPLDVISFCLLESWQTERLGMPRNLRPCW